MSAYTDLRNKNEKRISDFPIRFAFNSEQLDEILKEWDCEKKDLCNVGLGGVVRETDANAFFELIDDMEKELVELLKDDTNLIEALVYELANHEYCITGNPEDALEALGLARETMEEREINCLKIARQKYWEQEISHA